MLKNYVDRIPQPDPTPATDEAVAVTQGRFVPAAAVIRRKEQHSCAWRLSFKILSGSIG